MKKNVGATDITIRLVIVAATAILMVLGVLPILFDIILGIFAAIMLITSLIGFCPLYTIFGINTCEIEEEK